jgi:hypothetical protein
LPQPIRLHRAANIGILIVPICEQAGEFTFRTNKFCYRLSARELLITVLLMASGGPQFDDLENTLLQQAESALAVRGYFLSSPARAVLVESAITGAQRMRTEGKTAAEYLDKARANTDRWVEAISREAMVEQQKMQERARSHGLDETQVSLTTIPDNIMTTTLRSLCPGFWPFC